LLDSRMGWAQVVVGLGSACASREGGRLEC
jgi:hypothetical protein